MRGRKGVDYDDPLGSDDDDESDASSPISEGALRKKGLACDGS